MASFLDVLLQNTKKAVAQKATDIKNALVTNKVKQTQQQLMQAVSPLLLPTNSQPVQQKPVVNTAKPTPEQVLSPSGLKRYQEDQKTVMTAPIYSKGIPLLQSAGNAVKDFAVKQVELAKPVPRNPGEDPLSYALRSTGNFASNIFSQGYRAAEVAVPELRAATTIPNIIGSTSQAFLPEKVSNIVTPALQAYSIAKSPAKAAAIGNIAIDYLTDAGSKALTGKTLFQNIDESQLPDYAKGLSKTAYNIASGLGGAKVGKYGSDVYSAGRAALPSVKSAVDVYQKTGNLDKSLDALTALPTRPTNSVPNGPTMSEVLGYRKVTKPIDPDAAYNQVNKNVIKGKPEKLKAIPKVVEQEFRGDKLNIQNADELSRVENRLGDLGLTQRTVRSFEEMKRLAQELGADPKKLLANTKKITDAEVVGLKDLINQNADFLSKNRDINFTDKTQNEVHQMKVRAAEAQIDMALKKLIGGGTEAGRSIAAFKILASKTMDPAWWYTQAQKSKGESLTKEQRGTIDGLIKANDRTGLSLYVAGLRNPSGWEKATTFWKASLLTNPKTHVANILSNAAMGVTKLASDTISTGLDVGASLLTGKRTKTVSPLALLSGSVAGAKKGWNYIKTGIDPDELIGKVEAPRQVNYGNGTVGKFLNGYTNTVFRALGAEDAVFRGMHETESIANQAKLIAKNEKLKGGDYKQRVQALINNPTPEMKTQAIEEARVATFNNDNFIASKVNAWKGGRNREDSLASKLFSTVVDVTVPFVKTPSNVVARVAEYSPLGLLKLAARQVNPETRGQKSLVEDLGKVVTGGIVMGIGGALAEKGLLTGSIPADQKERDQFYAEGKQPNAIKVGDTWYSLNKISPIGYLLGLAADYHETGKDTNSLSERLQQTGLTGVKNLTDQTFLMGLGSTIKAITDPEVNGPRFVQQLGSSVIPSVVGEFARITDPTMRNPENPLQAIQQKIPFLSKGLAPRVDIFGEEVQNEGGWTRLFDPFNSKKDQSQDPVLQETRRQKVTIGLPSDKMYNTSLDAFEFADFQKVQGSVLKDVLNTIISSPEYQSAPESDKQEILNKTISEVRSETKEAVFPILIQRRFGIGSTADPALINELAQQLYGTEEFKRKSLPEQRALFQELVAEISQP